jgi:hypothetical protein
MALSTTTTTPTGWAADAAYQNYLKAQQIAAKPYTPYGGNMLAGANPNQVAGWTQLGNTGQYGQGAMTAAQAAAQGAAGYQAPTVNAWNPTAATGSAALMTAANAGAGATMRAGNAGPAAQMAAAQGDLSQMAAAQMDRGAVRDVTSKNFTDYDINQYMNPWINTVVNNGLADLSRQNDIVNNGTNARAAAAGAFGGSRQAVANTLNNENYLRESGNLSGTLRKQGFDAASGLIMQDANRDLQGQGMNQQMDFNVGSLNTNMSQQANQQNMLAANNMSQFNAGNRQAASQWNAGAQNQMAQYNTTNWQNAEANNQAAANQFSLANANNWQAAQAANQAAMNNMSQWNAGAQNSMAQYGADLNLRGQLANQSASQNAINTNLSAANALNGMGLDQQRWATNNANAQITAGNAMQQQEQAAMTDQYNRWLEAQGYDRNQLEYLRGALSGAPMGKSVVEPYHSNTAANMLAGGIGAGQILANAPKIISGGKALLDTLPDWGTPGWGW